MSEFVAVKIKEAMESGSWIRKMFEEGNKLKKEFGADRVYDFSLGNPMGEPPDVFIDALKTALADPTPGKHAYMPNAGYPDVRNRLAEVLSKSNGVTLTGRHLIMTVGAAGALNVALKSLVNPGETVIIFAPYFVEYGFYIQNVNARVRVVETDASFNLDINALEQAMDASVKALIINSPNNPTGRVYPEETLSELFNLLSKKRAEYGHPIYVLSDEPYKRIVYDNIVPPSMLKLYDETMVCTSFSKELSIPGERLGYIAVNPQCSGWAEIVDAMTFCNRTLGFVCAPALMQRALGLVPEASVDISSYEENRALLLKELRDIGYDMANPEGAFYLFIRSPLEDELQFIKLLAEERILVVPGRGFGRSGYFRLSYCVSKEVIQRALPGFRKVFQRVKEGL